MVLLAGPGLEGGGPRCVSPPPPSPPRDAQAREDPEEVEEEDYEDYEDFSRLPDTRSLASDDSFYPPGGQEELGAPSAPSAPEGIPEAATLLRAASANDVGLLRVLVRRGPSEEEVRETDRNGRVSPRAPPITNDLSNLSRVRPRLSRDRGAQRVSSLGDGFWRRHHPRGTPLGPWLGLDTLWGSSNHLPSTSPA